LNELGQKESPHKKQAKIKEVLCSYFFAYLQIYMRQIHYPLQRLWLMLNEQNKRQRCQESKKNLEQRAGFDVQILCHQFCMSAVGWIR
jgi:hypothetical protein